MRFACDRCKTRYSIADERVRGKILKIRCKACANVITVKEGMEEPGEGARITGEVPRVGGESERVHRPTTMAPQSTVGSGGVAPPAPALTAAFTSALSAPAPSQLEDEWYLSRDGDQQGPFGLRAAQAWVAQQPYDAELYCWCEGFDDWLPVDRIGHFQKLRARPQPPAMTPVVAAVPVVPAPAVAPAAVVAPVASVPAPAASRAASGPVPQVGAAAAGQRMVSGPVATVIGTPPVAAGVAARAASGPTPTMAGLGAAAAGAARAPSGPVAPLAAPGLGAAPVAARAPSGPVAPLAAPGLGAAPIAARAPSGPMARSSGRAEPEPSSASSSGGFSLEEKPSFAASLAALGSPAAQEGAASAAARPALESAPAVAAPASAHREPWPSASPAARGGFDAGDLGSDGFSPSASGAGLRTAHIASSFEDDLEFGEVSRVVRIADLNKSAPKPRAQAAAEPALPSGWSAPAGPAPGVGEVAATPALDASARSEVPVVIPAAQRRTHALLLGLVAIGLLGAGVTAFLLLQGSSPEDPMLISASNRDVRDLTIRPDDPRRPAGAGSQEHTSETPVRPTPTRKGNGPVATGKVDPPPTTGGKVEATGSSGPLTPLGGSEVEEMSQRNSSGLQRCYEQALKKDIFLDVKSIKVTISIDAAGVVNGVQMSSHGDHVLGQCMTSRIRNWRFRPNSRGLDAKFTVAFGRT